MDTTLEPLSHFYSVQRVAVAVQRDGTAAILGSLESNPFSLLKFSIWFAFDFFKIIFAFVLLLLPLCSSSIHVYSFYFFASLPSFVACVLPLKYYLE